MQTLNLGVIGVLFPTKNETIINDSIKKLDDSLYWLPWGNRFETLTKVCNYLYKNGYWECTSKKTDNGLEYFKYSINSKNPYRLIFFHHNSKSQKGTGLIYYKYYIDIVIIGKNSAIPIKSSNVKFEPIKDSSRVWFGISEVKRLGRDGYDFAGNFEVHPQFIDIKNREKLQVDAYKDAPYLYYQVLPVKEFFHKEKDCNCLLCR